MSRLRAPTQRRSTAPGLELNKTRVARLFLTKAGGKQSSSVLTPSGLENFSRLFATLNEALKHLAQFSEKKPFRR